MTIDFVSLTIIALIAALTPFLARAIPRGAVPETVFLLIIGALLGPNMAQLITVNETVSFLSDLGLAFLFLLAGFEINPSNLTGSQGKRGVVTWLVSLGLAFVAVRISPSFSISHVDGLAMAIALTTTALGTLLPIMKERGLMGTPVGDSILSYGTWGELGPVLAMALLLSSRAAWQTILILLLLAVVCVLIALFPSRMKRLSSRIGHFLEHSAETTAQTVVRLVVLLLMALVTFSALFDLDIVLGAFAAGFILRYIVPGGNESLERKLDGIAYGFFIPLFFVVSGAKIDLMAVASQPVLLVGFICMLLVIRALPIFIALSTGKDTRNMARNSRISVSLYCTTALPIIVAVTSVAVEVGAMEASTASVLVSAGALTVFIMPLLASVAYRVSDAEPVKAVEEIVHEPSHAGEIIRDHIAVERMMAHAKRHREHHGVPMSAEKRPIVQRAHAAHAAHVDNVARRFAMLQARRLRDLGFSQEVRDRASGGMLASAAGQQDEAGAARDAAAPKGAPGDGGTAACTPDAAAGALHPYGDAAELEEGSAPEER